MTFRVVVPAEQLTEQVKAYLEDDSCRLIVRRPVQAGPGGWIAAEGQTRKAAQHLRRQLRDLGIRAEVREEVPDLLEAPVELEGWADEDVDLLDELELIDAPTEEDADEAHDPLAARERDLLSWFGSEDEEDTVEAPGPESGEVAPSAVPAPPPLELDLLDEPAPGPLPEAPKPASLKSPPPPRPLDGLENFAVRGGAGSSRAVPLEPQRPAWVTLLTLGGVLLLSGVLLYLVLGSDEDALPDTAPPTLEETHVASADGQSSDARAQPDERAELESRIQGYYDKGIAAYYGKDWFFCRHEFGRVIQIDPDFGDAQERYDECVELLAKEIAPPEVQDVSSDTAAADTTPAPDTGRRVVVIEPDDEEPDTVEDKRPPPKQVDPDAIKEALEKQPPRPPGTRKLPPSPGKK